MIRKLLFAGGLLASAAWISYACFVHRLSENDVRESIARDLPLGASYSAVTAWINSQPHLRFPVYNPSDLPPKSTTAVIRDTGPLFNRSAHEIRMEFDFEAGRLIRSKVYEFQYSL
jgi:hypothetical protein